MSTLNTFLLLHIIIAMVNGASIKESSVYLELAQLSLKPPETYLKAMVPGTKWCGDGGTAKTYDDLGFFKTMDKCCRDHDHCDEYIIAGETKYGLSNNGSYTRLHCDCDYDFFECLKGADGLVAHIVGTGYFNAIGGKCFKLAHPATCVKTQSIIGFRARCTQYSYDTTKPMAWQWFDVPRYID